MDNGGSIGLGGILFVVFLILKLVGTIDWSWWWVTAPLWIPIAIAIMFFMLAGIVKMMLPSKNK